MKISQREARRLRKRVDELEDIISFERRRYGQEWPGGVEIARASVTGDALAAVATARKLRHAVVAVADDAAALVRFVALPHPEEP